MRRRSKPPSAPLRIKFGVRAAGRSEIAVLRTVTVGIGSASLSTLMSTGRNRAARSRSWASFARCCSPTFNLLEYSNRNGYAISRGSAPKSGGPSEGLVVGGRGAWTLTSGKLSGSGPRNPCEGPGAGTPRKPGGLPLGHGGPGVMVPPSGVSMCCACCGSISCRIS